MPHHFHGEMDHVLKVQVEERKELLT